MFTMKKEIVTFILILLIAWANDILPILDFCLGIALYYLLFRIIIIYSSKNLITLNRLKFILSRYNVFLLVHGLVFILLFFYIDFNIFQEQGDWFEYHHDGKSFSNYLRGQSEFSPIVNDALTYSYIIGLIYYLFSDSISLALVLNIFLVITSSIWLYILVERIFDFQVAKYALYLSAFYPYLFLYEILLLKECLIFFLTTLITLHLYKYYYENKKGSIFILIPLFIALFNTRFFLIFPFFIFFLYHEIFINKKIIKVIIVFSILVLILNSYMNSNDVFKEGTFGDAFFQSGMSIIDADRSRTAFNYQIKGTDIISFGNILVNNWQYYLTRVPLYYTNVWTLERIYYIPFLSKKYKTSEFWLFNLLTYINSLFVWTVMFVSLWGFKRIFFDYRKMTSLIWIPLIVIPIIVAIFSNNQRYFFVCIYSTIPCISYGLVHCKKYKDYIILSVLLIITLIVFVNMDTFIFYPIIVVLLFFVANIMGFLFFRRDSLLEHNLYNQKAK